MENNLTTEETLTKGAELAKIFAEQGEEAVQAAFTAIIDERKLTKTAQKMLRKQFRLSAGIDKTPIKKNSTLKAEQALADAAIIQGIDGDAAAKIPPTLDVSIDPAEHLENGGAAASINPDDIVENTPVDPSPADAEKLYGAARLKEMLAEGADNFAAELKGGVEDAVARAIFAAMFARPGQRGVGHKIRVLKSTIESPVKAVWDLCDEMSARCAGIPKRHEVITAAEEMGVASGTARTQHQSWFKARKPEFVAKGWLEA